jgi:hypothetical protein
VAVDQSVYFAYGLKATEFVFLSNIITPILPKVCIPIIVIPVIIIIIIIIIILS